jgi:hypothetical protein
VGISHGHDKCNYIIIELLLNLHDGEYCGQHCKTTYGKSNYTSTHIIYHNSLYATITNLHLNHVAKECFTIANVPDLLFLIIFRLLLNC